ncbi:hypothetical protein Tco_0826567 [Tanacetum coccineum]
MLDRVEKGPSVELPYFSLRELRPRESFYLPDVVIQSYHHLVTVLGTLFENHFANSGHLSESMNDEIFMIFGTPMMNPVSTVHLSLNAASDSLALLTILVTSCGSLKHALLTEYLAVNASLRSNHSLMLLDGRRSNQPLADPSRVCWNILHHTGMGHLPELAALANMLK